MRTQKLNSTATKQQQPSSVGAVDVANQKLAPLVLPRPRPHMPPLPSVTNEEEEATMGARHTAFCCLCTLLLLVPPIYSSEEASVPTIDVHAARRLTGSDHIYLDVRTAKEFYEGHVKNSINVPYLFFTDEGKVKNPKFLEQVLSVCKKDDLIVVGCLGGVRSLHAAEELMNAGFKHVKNFGGGYAAWVENGFSVVSRPRSEL